MKDTRFFERRCFAITSNALLEFMKEQKNDDSLTFEMDEDTREILLYSHKFDIEYDEDDIMDCAGKEFETEFNYLFVSGDRYLAIIYLMERKLNM